MGLWSFYFIAKIFLYYRGSIAFYAIPNLLLIGYLSIPFWLKQRKFPAPWLIAHQVLGFFLAAAVFWHDSYLPPFFANAAFLSNPANRPSASYVLSFVLSYWNTTVASVLAGAFALTVAARKKDFWIGPFVLVASVVSGVQNFSATRAPLSVNDEVAKFFQEQAGAKHVVHLDKPAESAPPFDIVFIHVCSMSWDDLTHAGLDRDPFFSQFDVLLTRFNTVSSYSEPSMLRLLRSTCGQVDAMKLREKIPAECSLMTSLKNAGYTPYMLFNHDAGSSDKMAEEAQTLAGAPPLEKIESPKIEAVSFDGTDVYENYDLLKKFWVRRVSAGAPRAALYYDSMSLHVGVHQKDEPKWWNRDPVPHYREAALKAFGDYRKFFDDIKASGRDVLVVMVPEHGAAIVGNRLQNRDLREIPLPQITTVPVGFKFFGRGYAPKETLRIDRPTSYTAIAYVIEQALKRRASSDANPFPESIAAEIPETGFLADNANARVIPHEGNVFYQWDGGSWNKLAPDLYPRADVFPERLPAQSQKAN